jgi:membrane protease subunit (stomatin/prohibitin family)
MGISIDKSAGEFIENVEWIESPESDVLAWRFPCYQNEIKMGAKLVVGEGQNAVLVNEGRLADVYKPGTHMLGTHSMPILTKLMGWKYAFNSPFKTDVYFISMRQCGHRRWVTHDPIAMCVPRAGVVRIRAWGTYALKVTDPKLFLQQLVFTDPAFETLHSPQRHLSEISPQLLDTIVSRVAEALRTAKIPLLDLARNCDKISDLVMKTIGSDLATLGLALTAFNIETIFLPLGVAQALDTGIKRSVHDDRNRNNQHQGDIIAIDETAKSPGGTAYTGISVAAGIAGQQMRTHMNPPGGPPVSAAFFVAVNGAPTGPYNLNALVRKTRDSSLTRETLVWREGMAEWTRADAVPELQSLFAPIPPPLPVMVKTMAR